MSLLVSLSETEAPYFPAFSNDLCCTNRAAALRIGAHMQTSLLLAVNGTLMRGLELNNNLIEAGASFIREAQTEPVYRLFSIGDRHPGMFRVRYGGASVAVELWSVPPAGLASVLVNEPAGLSIGKITLTDGTEVLGVLAEPVLCEGQQEITVHGGWRAYLASIRSQPAAPCPAD